MISDAQLQSELAIANGDIVRMQTLVARAREANRNLIASDIGLLSADEYRNVLAWEQQECARIDDAVAVVEVELDRELAEEEELALYSDMRGLAMNPGDLIGKTGPATYQLAMPWSNEQKAASMERFVAGIVADALPTVSARLGHATLRAAAPAPIELHDAPNRAPIIRTTRHR
jgi:hypothetical protein